MKYSPIILVFLAYFSLFCADSANQHSAKFNFLSFKQIAIQTQPELASRSIQAYKPSMVSLGEFRKTIDQFRYRKARSLIRSAWLDINPFLVVSNQTFKPFAQKLVVPQGTQVAFFGDLHGNIHALCDLLSQLIQDGYLDNELHILKDNFYLVFLGDYVDRGLYGVEVVYLLLQLYLANPEHVILVRGNHEDQDLNQAMGFTAELEAKFGQFPMKSIYQIYDLMPCVLYLGTESGDFVQCCHGGLEAGFNARLLLEHQEKNIYQSIHNLERKVAIQKLNSLLKLEVLKRIPDREIIDFIPQKPTAPVTLGFLWHDFTEQGNDSINYMPGRGWKYGKAITQQLLAQSGSKSAHICGVFRAHQHYGQMLEFLTSKQGIVSLWDGIVHTFLSAPIPGSNFPYASCGIVTVANSFSDWTMKHLVIKL